MMRGEETGMTKQEYDELQNNLSSLLEKKDINGRKVERSQDYIDAVMASKSVLHSWFCWKGEKKY